MAETGSAGDWSDQVNELAASTDGAVTEDKTAYAIKWGEKVEVGALPCSVFVAPTEA